MSTSPLFFARQNHDEDGAGSDSSDLWAPASNSSFRPSHQSSHWNRLSTGESQLPTSSTCVSGLDALESQDELQDSDDDGDEDIGYECRHHNGDSDSDSHDDDDSETGDDQDFSYRSQHTSLITLPKRSLRNKVKSAAIHPLSCCPPVRAAAQAAQKRISSAAETEQHYKRLGKRQFSALFADEGEDEWNDREGEKNQESSTSSLSPIGVHNEFLTSWEECKKDVQRTENALKSYRHSLKSIYDSLREVLCLGEEICRETGGLPEQVTAEAYLTHRVQCVRCSPCRRGHCFGFEVQVCTDYDGRGNLTGPLWRPILLNAHHSHSSSLEAINCTACLWEWKHGGTSGPADEDASDRLEIADGECADDYSPTRTLKPQRLLKTAPATSWTKKYGTISASGSAAQCASVASGQRSQAKKRKVQSPSNADSAYGAFPANANSSLFRMKRHEKGDSAEDEDSSILSSYPCSSDEAAVDHSPRRNVTNPEILAVHGGNSTAMLHSETASLKKQSSHHSCDTDTCHHPSVLIDVPVDEMHLNLEQQSSSECAIDTLDDRNASSSASSHRGTFPSTPTYIEAPTLAVQTGVSLLTLRMDQSTFDSATAIDAHWPLHSDALPCPLPNTKGSSERRLPSLLPASHLGKDPRKRPVSVLARDARLARNGERNGESSQTPHPSNQHVDCPITTQCKDESAKATPRDPRAKTPHVTDEASPIAGKAKARQKSHEGSMSKPETLMAVGTASSTLTALQHNFPSSSP